MTSFQFKTGERLKSKKVIDSLFKEGQSFGQYPLRIVWMASDQLKSDFLAQFALSVPKRKFPKAVHRNRIRRQVREAYRLNKHKLYRGLEKHEQQYAIMVLYVAKEALPYATIENAMKGIIHRFLKKIKSDS
ncbi:MAG: ribonuclease P protein component [Bacteroidota bacterium]